MGFCGFWWGREMFLSCQVGRFFWGIFRVCLGGQKNFDILFCVKYPPIINELTAYNVDYKQLAKS